jgi:putative alpha-1,2-mannosidase
MNSQYAFDDFTIAQVARAMGKNEEMTKYLNRSKGFEHVWNPETNIKGLDGHIVPYIKGFMQVRCFFVNSSED